MCLIADFNNKGVELLEHGFYVDAVHMFAGALQILNQSMYGENSQSIHGENSLSPTERIQRARGKMIQTSGMKCSLGKRSQASVVFMYCKPMKIEQFPKADKIQSLSWAILLFNIALAHHQRAFLHPSLMKSSFNKAMVAYESLCESMIEWGDLHSSSSRLIFGVLNNMGQICHEIGKFDEARFLFQKMSQVAERLTKSQAQELGEDRMDFVLNALILSLPSAAAVA